MKTGMKQVRWMTVLSICLTFSACGGPKSIGDAVRRGDVHDVRVLLERGEDPNQEDGQGKPILIGAVQSGNLEIVQLLLQHGVAVDATYEGVPALIFAALPSTRCSAPMLRELLSNGANPDVTDSLTRATPLLNVAAAGDEECVALLLEAGANTEVRDAAGGGLVYHTALSGNVELLKSFASLGVPVDTPDSHGVTPLMIAAAAGNSAMVGFLIQKGANRCALDKRGRSPRDIALQNHHRELQDFLPVCFR